MQTLKILVKCLVPGCFTNVEVTVPMADAMPQGWRVSKVQVHLPEAKGACPAHSAGEIAAGRAEP
jgi:hypothetical protein